MVRVADRGDLFRGSWRKILDSVSISVRRGQSVGILGPSGGGKTTLGLTAAGLLTPAKGSVAFAGDDLGALSRQRRRAIRKELQVVFQQGGAIFPPHFTLEQLTTEPLYVHSLAESRAEAIAKVEALLEAFGVGHIPKNKRLGEMSFGEMQRAVLVRAFATRPKLVILDEPTSAVDVALQASILNSLVRFQDELSTAYLLISHDPWVVRYLCTHVYVVAEGRVVESGPLEAVFQRPYHAWTQSILASARGRTASDGSLLAASVGNQKGVAPSDRQARPSTREEQLVEVEPGHFVRAASR